MSRSVRFERNHYIGWLRCVRGYTMSAIARVFGLTRARIYQIVQWYVFTARRYGPLASYRLCPLCVRVVVFP